MGDSSQSGTFANMNVRTPRPREPWEVNLSQIQMNNLERYRSQKNGNNRNANNANANNRNGNNKRTVGTAASIAQGLRIERAQENNVQISIIVDGNQQNITVLEGDGLLNTLVDKGIIKDKANYKATLTLENKTTHETQTIPINIITSLLDLADDYYGDDLENFNIILTVNKKSLLGSLGNTWRQLTKRFYGGKKRRNRRRKTCRKRKNT